MLSEVAGEVLNLELQPHEVLHAKIFRIESG
jgi:hypothetical protein